ncbi:hypothetical protein Tco_0353491 [Tanacetum coccineum]
MPHDSPLPRGHTLGSDEGRTQYNELMDLVTKLSDRVVALETELKKTKKVYGADFIKLIKKVKRLDKKDKLSKSRRKLRLVLSNKEGISTASTDFTTANVRVTTAGAEISTTSPEVKTVGNSVDDIAAESLVYIRRSAAKTKDKAVRLQEEFDEEERQRIARVHEATRSFTEEEWEDIRARVKASEELQLKRLSFDEIKDLFETTMRRANTFVPIETEIRKGVPELVVDSSQAAVIESTEAGGEGMNIEALQTKYPIIDGEVYTEDSRMYWKIIRVGNHTERLYDTCGVHHVSTKDGVDIYMLFEREYPLSRGVLTQMLVAKLLVEQNNKMSRELLKKIFMQIERPRK